MLEVLANGIIYSFHNEFETLDYLDTHCDKAYPAPSSISSIEDLKAADRIIELPCPIGAPIFLIVTKRSKAWMSNEYSFIKPSKLTYNNLEHVLSCLGKTAFVTREDANAALEKIFLERTNKNNPEQTKP